MVTINGTPFELYNYSRTAEGVRMTINNATTAEIETAAGDSANIAISDEYRGNGMKISSIYKKYGNPIQHEIDFVKPDLEAVIQQNATDIELQAGAIEELAELIAVATTTAEPEEEEEE